MVTKIWIEDCLYCVNSYITHKGSWEIFICGYAHKTIGRRKISDPIPDIPPWCPRRTKPKKEKTK